MANSIPEDKQLPILLTSISASTYHGLSELLAPVALSSKSVSDIFQLLQTHFEPEKVQIAECFNLEGDSKRPGKPLAITMLPYGNWLSAAGLASAFTRNCGTRWSVWHLKQSTAMTTTDRIGSDVCKDCRDLQSIRAGEEKQ